MRRGYPARASGNWRGRPGGAIVVPSDGPAMRFRYRPFATLPLLLLGGALAAVALAAAWAAAPWESAALLAAPVATASALLVLAQREEAHRLGALVLDGAGLRRVRGDGRVVNVVRWEEIHAVQVDPSRREALVLVPGGGGFPVRGPALLGGVGLEHFAAFVDVLPDYTSAPVRLPGRALR